MKEITNVLPTRDSICNGQIPKETMTMRQIRRHIEWLINTAKTAGKLGNKKAVKARLAEVIEFDEILPTRTFEELQEEWHGQCQAMVDEAYERIKEMQRTIKRKTTPTRGWKYQHRICWPDIAPTPIELAAERANEARLSDIRRRFRANEQKKELAAKKTGQMAKMAAKAKQIREKKQAQEQQKWAQAQKHEEEESAKESDRWGGGRGDWHLRCL
jgi:ribosomal protein L28